MAFTKQERREIIADIINANRSFTAAGLSKLTDNQLVGLSDAEQLDLVINERDALKEWQEEQKKKAKVAAAQDKDEEEPTDNEDEEELVEEEEEEPTDNEDEVIDEEEEEIPPKQQTTNRRRRQFKSKSSKRLSTNTWMRQAPPEVRRLVANAQRVEREEKEGLIDQIVANSSNEFSEDDLMSMNVNTLKNIARLARADSSVGMWGSTTANTRKSDQEPLVAPSLDF